jgi:dTDP-4-amino-4,6-dideoxygalactose transaminase
VLTAKVARLPAWNGARQRHAAAYRELLGGIDHVTLPREAGYATHVYHIFAIRVGDRASLMSALAEEGIQCGIHYPIPLHLQEAYRSCGHGPGSFPVAERCAEQFLSLPMFPELTTAQIECVVQAIDRYYAGVPSRSVATYPIDVR